MLGTSTLLIAETIALIAVFYYLNSKKIKCNTDTN